MNLKGNLVGLRAVEPKDIDVMYAWENDPEIWGLSSTLTPFSRHMLKHFVSDQKSDIFQTRQLRLMIETLHLGPEALERAIKLNSQGVETSSEDGSVVGTIDLFDFDPVNLRAGVGILIYDAKDRGKGYASDALEMLCRYAGEVLRMHQLWCNTSVENKSCIALFRSAGFVEIGVKRQWLITPDGYKDEVMMQKIFE